jgi:LysM repeat protein
MRRKLLYVLLIIVFLTAAINYRVPTVSASTVSAAELISLVNSLRTGVYGLAALIEDSILDSTASSTAYQMAMSGVCAHLGGARERIAAAGFGGGATIFATENMACATSATIDWIRQVWADEQHMYPMVKASYTHIGAGTYTASSGVTYYVVHAAYVAGSSGSYTSSTSSSGSSSAAATADMSNYVQPVVTATPNGDGDIYHTVLYGQSLFAIATWYGVTVEKIKQMNSLTSDSIYEGQKLLISIKPTPTITPTRTATIPQPTRTPSATKKPPTPMPTITVTPTLKPNLGNALAKIDRQYLGLGLLVISAIGFLVVLFTSFLRPRAEK